MYDMRAPVRHAINLRFLEENAVTEAWLSTDDRDYKCVWDNFRNEKLITAFHTHTCRKLKGMEWQFDKVC